MVVKSKRTPLAVGPQSPVICDDVLVRNDGQHLRIVVDLVRTQQDAERYYKQLLFSRSIPFDLTQISPTDRVIRAVIAAMPWLTDTNGKTDAKEILRATGDYYAQHSLDAYRAAMMLAIIASPENIFNEAPTPYDEEAEEALPGLVQIPAPTLNLANPVEKRLKQLMDFFVSDPGLLTKFFSLTEQATINLNKLAGSPAEVNQDGFQPEPAR
jgi:hypothetical protein